jgi:hypothetical protein
LFLPDDAALSALTAAENPGEARRAQRLEMLRVMADICLDMARLVQSQAHAAAEADPAGGRAADIAAKVPRIARALRQTLALEWRVETEEAAQLEAERAARAQAEDRARHRLEIERACTVREAVEKIIRADETVDPLFVRREAAERLDDEQEFEDFLTRPLGAIVADICRDLSLEPDWTLWPEPWAAEAADYQASWREEPDEDPPDLPDEPRDADASEASRRGPLRSLGEGGRGLKPPDAGGPPTAPPP